MVESIPKLAIAIHKPNKRLHSFILVSSFGQSILAGTMILLRLWVKLPVVEQRWKL
jgi:hypothetical protein